MTRKAAARTQHQAGAARRDETEDGTGRKARPVRKTNASGAETTVANHGPTSDAPVAGGTMPPPHPALVDLVRLLARSDARRARAEEKETR